MKSRYSSSVKLQFEKTLQVSENIWLASDLPSIRFINHIFPIKRRWHKFTLSSLICLFPIIKTFLFFPFNIALIVSTNDDKKSFRMTRNLAPGAHYSKFMGKYFKFHPRILKILWMSLTKNKDEVTKTKPSFHLLFHLYVKKKFQLPVCRKSKGNTEIRHQQTSHQPVQLRQEHWTPEESWSCVHYCSDDFFSRVLPFLNAISNQPTKIGSLLDWRELKRGLEDS